MWVCGKYPACDAYVGCHRRSTKPLGRLANATLRKWKQNAHRAFDRLWKKGIMKRWEAYRWLGKTMGIDVAHIGEFDVVQCQRVVELCGSVKPMQNYYHVKPEQSP